MSLLYVLWFRGNCWRQMIGLRPIDSVRGEEFTRYVQTEPELLRNKPERDGFVCIIMVCACVMRWVGAHTVCSPKVVTSMRG